MIDLRLSGCALSSTLPSQLSLLTNLRAFTAASAQLSGAIPNLDTLSALTLIGVFNNSLTGSIPSALYSNANLDTCVLGGRYVGLNAYDPTATNCFRSACPSQCLCGNASECMHLPKTLMPMSMPSTSLQSTSHLSAIVHTIQSSMNTISFVTQSPSTMTFTSNANSEPVIAIIAGIVAAFCALVVLVAVMFWWRRRLLPSNADDLYEKTTSGHTYPPLATSSTHVNHYERFLPQPSADLSHYVNVDDISHA